MKRLFCLLALLLLTGCGGDELQRFTIVTAAAVDVRDDLYRVTVEGTGQRLDETGRPELLVVTGEGRTLTECLSDIQCQCGRYPYLRHTSLLVLSEAAVQERLDALCERMLGDHSLRINTRLMVCPGDPAELFGEEEEHSQTLLSRSAAEADTLTTDERTLNELLYDVFAEGVDVTLPLVENDRSGGLLLLHGENVAGTLDERLTPAFLLACGRARTGSVTASAGGRETSFRLLDAERDFSVTLEDGVPVLHLSMRLGFRAERETDGEASLRDTLKDQMREMLDVLRKSGCDALGAGQYLRRHAPDDWAAVREDWARLYARSRAEVDVQVTVESAGRAEEMR